MARSESVGAVGAKSSGREGHDFKPKEAFRCYEMREASPMDNQQLGNNYDKFYEKDVAKNKAVFRKVGQNHRSPGGA